MGKLSNLILLFYFSVTVYIQCYFVQVSGYSTVSTRSYALRSVSRYFQHLAGTTHSYYNVIDYFLMLCLTSLKHFCDYQTVVLKVNLVL